MIDKSIVNKETGNGLRHQPDEGNLAANIWDDETHWRKAFSLFYLLMYVH